MHLITISRINRIYFLLLFLFFFIGCKTVTVKISKNSYPDSYSWRQTTQIESILSSDVSQLSLSLIKTEEGLFSQDGYEILYIEKSRYNPITEAVVVESSDNELPLADNFYPYLNFIFLGTRLKEFREWKFNYKTEILYKLELEGTHFVSKIIDDYVVIVSTGDITSAGKETIEGVFEITTKISAESGVILEQVANLSFKKESDTINEISTENEVDIYYITQ